MKKTIYLLTLTAILAGSTWSCKKALDIEPRQSIDASTALTTKDGINAALISVYSRLKNLRVYGRDLIALPEALADNGFATNKSGRLLPEANNNNGAHFTLGLWQTAYSGINQANLILEAIPSATDPLITAADRTSWEGQIYFLRALNHFNLVVAYSYMPSAVVGSQNRGGVPLMLKSVGTSDEALALLPSRAPIDDVYASITADLQSANTRLTNTPLPNSANKVAAQALLSRVNLYRGNYTEAKRWADSAINSAGTKLSTAANYITNFRAATNPETLFQVFFATNAENLGVNESLQTSFTTLTAPGVPNLTGGFGDLVPTLSLLTDLGITLTGGNTNAVFTTGNASIATRSADVRNLMYEVGSTGRGLSKVETTKFIGKNGFPNLDNIPVIRIAEVYLNRAEAMATPGSPVFNEAAALADLNKIATNRGLTAFTLTGSDLYEEIIRQRRIELAFEGHRFFDLKRLGRDIVKTPHYVNLNFTDTRILAPIPQREVDGNKNLAQNPGY
jgi:starch-binding outer membrane protein, SusD/RagB family